MIYSLPESEELTEDGRVSTDDGGMLTAGGAVKRWADRRRDGGRLDDNERSSIRGVNMTLNASEELTARRTTATNSKISGWLSSAIADHAAKLPAADYKLTSAALINVVRLWRSNENDRAIDTTE